MKKLALIAITALFPLAMWGWADTLILRDGSRHVGRFVSGSSNGITFQDDSGNRRFYNLGEVQSVEFERLRSGRVDNRTGINTDNAGAVNANSIQARSIPAGTAIVVRTNEQIDTTSASEGRTYSGVVDRDITDSTGSLLVPKGSQADLVVRDVNTGGTTGSPELVLDLQSININGQRYLVSTQDVTQGNQQGLGKNKRTAEMVGGGAVLGTILGAIAGGGKGAAIGAAAGAAAGAGVQVLTRGKEVKVPAETDLTFKLDRPIHLVAQR